MKKILIMLPVIAALMMTSCKKEDTGSISTTEAEGTIPGNWKVTYYFDNSNGESNDFDNYSFTFGTDRTVTATSGASGFNGFWTVSNSDDDPNFDTEIEFTISGNNVMDELDGKWLITELSDTVIKLKDDSGAEEIHFGKI